MIINMMEPNDSKYFNILQKARGIQLISKYLPNLSVHKQVYVVDTIEDWNKIKDIFPKIVTVRTDSINGKPIPNIGGTTCKKENVEQYLKRAFSIEKEPYFICMELEEKTGERVNTKGGILIDATVDGMVHIGYVGPGFDCRELTKGKAEHETWTIPWNDLIFIKSSNINKYHIQTISQQAYRATSVERIEFLINEYPERKKEIINKMPKEYNKINPIIMENLLEKVLIPLYFQKKELQKDGLNKFDVELNVLSDGKFVPMEICIPDRFVKTHIKKFN